MTCCETHNVSLSSRCSACGSAIHYHRIPIGTADVGSCTACGLAFSGTVANGVATPELLAIQSRARNAISEGQEKLWGENVSPSEWFAVMKILAEYIRRGVGSSSDSVRSLLEHLGVDCDAFNLGSYGLSVEMMEVGERREIMHGVSSLMFMARAELIDMFKEWDVSREALLGSNKSAPSVFAPIVDALETRSRSSGAIRKILCKGPRSRSAVIQSMKHLRKHAKWSRNGA